MSKKEIFKIGSHVGMSGKDMLLQFLMGQILL